MATTAELLADLEALKSTLRSGALVVEFNGRRVRYRSQSELLAAIAQIEGELGTTRGRSVVIRPPIDRGW